MSNQHLTSILQVKIVGLADPFVPADLTQKATDLLKDLENQLDPKTFLKDTTMDFSLRLDVDEAGKPFHWMLVGLKLISQLELDFYHSDTSDGDIEQKVLEDRQRLVNACRNLPTKNGLTATQWAERTSSAVLNVPQERVVADLHNRITRLASVKNRHWHVHIDGNTFQHELPSIARYEWRRELVSVKVLLDREKRGFSLRLMHRDTLPSWVQRVSKLTMPERPKNIEVAGVLDRAELTGSPVKMLIRLGSRPGSEQLTVADMVRLENDPYRPAFTENNEPPEPADRFASV